MVCPRPVLVVALTLAAAEFAAAPAGAQETLDQSLPSGGAPDFAIGNYSGPEFVEAQTFTAGLTGRMHTVALPLWTAGEHGRYLLTVQGVSVSGTPNGSVLARRAIDTCRLRTAGLWQDYAFATPANVVANQRYALVLARDPVDPLGTSNGVWRGSPSTYTRGNHYWQDLTAGPAWNDATPLAFRTYVSASAPLTASDATELALSVAPNPALTDRAVNLTVTVRDPVHPDRTPTGSVTIYGTFPDGQSRPLDAHGQATLPVTFPFTGDRALGAAYCPDSDAFVSSEGTGAITVYDRYASQTTVAVDPEPAVAGQPATLTATVSAHGPSTGAPTGTVRFIADGTPLGTDQPLQDGRASVVTTARAGGHNLRAEYSGDDAFAASTGTIAQTVDRASTQTAITSDTNPVLAGDELTFTLEVQSAAPGAVTPRGTVSITADGLNISGALPLFATGATSAAVQATFTAPTTPQTNTIRAFYSGDSETKPSASASFVQAVQARAPDATRLTTVAPVTVAPVSVAPPPTAAPATAAVGAPALRTLTAPLLRMLARRGLKALADTRPAFTAAAPGTLTQRLYTPREPGAGRKSTLLAASKHHFGGREAPGSNSS